MFWRKKKPTHTNEISPYKHLSAYTPTFHLMLQAMLLKAENPQESLARNMGKVEDPVDELRFQIAEFVDRHSHHIPCSALLDYRNRPSEEVQLLSKMVDKFGIEGTYSFFAALSEQPDHTVYIQADEKKCKEILGQIFMKHFSPATLDEKILLAETLMSAARAAFGLGGVGNTVVSGSSWALTRAARRSQYTEPPLEVMDHVLPILPKLKALADVVVSMMNEYAREPFVTIKPDDLSSMLLPPLAEINHSSLERLLHDVRNQSVAQRD